VDDLDGPPLARVASYHRRERAAPELVRHVVLRVHAGQLLRREVPVDELRTHFAAASASRTRSRSRHGRARYLILPW